MAKATVRIRVVGGSRALQDIQGLRRETAKAGADEKKVAGETAKAAKQAAAEQIRAARKAEAEAKKAAERAAREQTRHAREVSRAAAREAEKQRREADRLSAHWARVSQRSADKRIRDEQRATRAAAREAAKQERLAARTLRTRQEEGRRGLRRAGGFFGALAAGAISGGVSAIGQARGIAGVDDVATRVQKANDFREVTTVLGSNAGMDEAAIAALQEKILATATKNAKDPLEIVQGLAAGQERFNLLEPLAENIDAITEAAKSSLGTVPEFIGMIGSLTTAFGLSSDEMKDALNIVVGAARAGAIDPADFASSFASTAGVFATATGQRGMEGLRQFVGTAQAVGAGQFGGSESATRVERFVAELNDIDTQKKLKAKGVNVVGKDGKIDIGSVIEQIAGSKRLSTSAKRQTIFKEVRASQGLEQLLAQREKVARGEAGAVDFATMSQIEASAGAEGTAEIMRRLEKGGTLDVQRQAIEMQKHTIENLDQFNAQILLVTKAGNDLEKAFGSLSLWASSIGATALGTGGAVLGGKLLGAGAAGAAGAGTGAALAGAGSGLAALGAGTIAAASLIAGGAGYAIGYGIDEASAAFSKNDKKLSERLENWLLSWGDPNDIVRGGERGLDKPEEIKIDVDVKDSRTEAKVTRKQSRGPTVTTTLGPLVIGG